MRNVTITLDEETATWARIEAARLDTSVSKLLGELLREHMRSAGAYEAAMRDYLSVKPARIRRAGRYPTRDEVYDRARLR